MRPERCPLRAPYLMLAALLVSLVSLRAGAAPVQPAPVIIGTTTGAVSGSGGEVLTFKGIPYAAAPTGPLRWRAPQPPLAWPGVRDATRFGDDCMQTPYVIPTGQKAS